MLSDSNERLIRTYIAVRDHVENVIGMLRWYEERHKTLGKDFYYPTRAQAIDHLGDVGVAAWFIYMNKTCFNGLYRVNRNGNFNVPMGRYENPGICDATGLRACSEALRGVELTKFDFRSLATHPKCAPGAFVYFDPPYAPLSATSDFTGYTKDNFTGKDHADLRNLIWLLKAKGVHVLLSNSSAPLIRELYQDKFFQVEEVMAKRAINSATDKRGNVKELLIS